MRLLLDSVVGCCCWRSRLGLGRRAGEVECVAGSVLVPRPAVREKCRDSRLVGGFLLDICVVYKPRDVCVEMMQKNNHTIYEWE